MCSRARLYYLLAIAWSVAVANAVKYQTASTTLSQAPAWRSCSASGAAFQISAVDLSPQTTIPPGGALALTMSGTNQQQVTAGPATVTVYYYSFRVLTASDTLCTSPAQAVPDAMHPAEQHAGLTAVEGMQEFGSYHSSSGSSNNYAHFGLQGRTVEVKRRRALSSMPASSSTRLIEPLARRLLAGDPSITCSMPAGPVVLHHEANLPGIAPRGSYRMRLAAADAITGQELMCVDVWFRVG